MLGETFRLTRSELAEPALPIRADPERDTISID